MVFHKERRRRGEGRIEQGQGEGGGESAGLDGGRVGEGRVSVGGGKVRTGGGFVSRA